MKGQSLTSNDQRKNWTDYQETAQWLSGVEIPLRVLETLGVGGSSLDLELKLKSFYRI